MKFIPEVAGTDDISSTCVVVGIMESTKKIFYKNYVYIFPYYTYYQLYNFRYLLVDFRFQSSNAVLLPGCLEIL